MTKTPPIFSFSALPTGSGGEFSTPPSYNKRTRTDDLLCDKLKASQVTSSELESPSLHGLGAPPSYASRLLNLLSNYRNAAVENFEWMDDDVVYTQGKSGPKVCFSQRVNDKLALEWRCAVVVKLMGKPNTQNAYKFMFDSLKRKWNMLGNFLIFQMITL